MIHRIKTSKLSKIVACYLAVQLVGTIIAPTAAYALTSGPTQPEFNAFTPIGTSDMVNLSSGNFNYNIPIMDVGGYPLNLAYDSGVTMDQEASWVGLGWNLNVGQINRQVRGIPDDFKGDEIVYENNMRDNVTVGLHAGLDPQIFGLEQSDLVNLGVDLKYNNYTGISFTPSYGLSFGLSETLSVGVQVETSATEGATISPRVNAKTELQEIIDGAINGSRSAGVSYNSSKGLTDFSLSGGVNAVRNYQIETVNVSSGSGKISFLNNTLTPRKRTAFRDISGTLSVSLGPDIWGFDGEVEISATGSVQQIKDKLKRERAFGYEFTGFATPNDILDYNREKEQLISKITLALPTTSYTYDLYTVQGQGAGGMFRPFRSQVGQINDEFVQDESASFSLGLEIEAGSGFHTGVNFTEAPSKSSTGVWDTRALKHFKQTREDKKESGESLAYEPVYFKYIGEPSVDQDQDLFDDLGGYQPVALKIGGSKGSFNKYADTRFRKKKYAVNGDTEYQDLPSFSNKFKREQRDVRNQNVQKISAAELDGFYTKKDSVAVVNKHAKPHHTAEIRMQQGDGSTYVFGQTAYNTLKREVTFATDSKDYNCATGIVQYASGENTTDNGSGIDHFFNAVNTPAYAHTYLLSSVLSSDYEDLKGDGPTDDDLGSYTNFTYKTFDDYKWRLPFELNEASYNAGLNTNLSDQKGSYIYGEKELKYIEKIETKTHIAIFDLSERKDGKGVDGENGGGSVSGPSMYKIDQIRLYSKPEYKKYEKEIEDDDPKNDPSPSVVSPIKTAHFVYNYSQCKEVENNLGGELDTHELSNDGGKLTLKEVYFTYRTSNMGKYTPYRFNYDGFNPDYNLKSYDVWGNYKPNIDGGCNTEDDITAPEFPFVQQDDKELQDQYAGAWMLSSIDLPSGGKIDLEYESDDYKHVQDRDAMQMFKVVGVGNVDAKGNHDNPTDNQLLYKGAVGEAKYLYVELPEESNIDIDFKSKYLKNGVGDKPIYFRFLLNMTKAGALSTNNNNFDYVTGYFEKEGSVEVFKAEDDKIYAAIPMRFSDLEGGIQGGQDVNPISKAGWYFGRQNLHGLVYGLNMDARSQSVTTIVKKIISSFSAITDIISGPNGKLRSNEFLCAQRFVPEKSWIRLSAPKSYKLGGGVRVKKLSMQDQWNKMLNRTDDDSERYNKEYGQTYTYTLEDGSSSGVATYEPGGSKENPFVEPFYNKADRLIAPREVSYVERPFGESFFPGATVTYSRVEVSNIAREGITKHATGTVVTEYFTSKDYPTKVDFTDIDSPENYTTNENNVLGSLLSSIFGGSINVKNEYALSQGFVVHTNDMNGKMRLQKVFAEGQDKPISSVEYKYNTQQNDVTQLSNTLPVIFSDGSIADRQIGVDYDMVTDFRESYSNSQTKGYKNNLVVLIIGIFPIPIPSSFSSSTTIENVAHTTMTTKVIHTTAVMKEKVAMDLGSKVSTVNEAWDAETGQVLLTKTVNEFDDQYYNFNFPAYWSYETMGQASKNIGLTGTLDKNGEFFKLANAKDYFAIGDEIMAEYKDGEIPSKERLWVVGFDTPGNGVLLMNRNGSVINRDQGPVISGDVQFKIIRSGYRNQQIANMASITMMKNPLPNKDGNGVYQGKIDTNTFALQTDSPLANNQRIINASAVEYEDFWNCQCESKLPFIPEVLNADELKEITQKDYPFDSPFNPYLYNAKGEWRAKRSYAYLTERNNIAEIDETSANSRREGYFKEFNPYYKLSEDGKWEKSVTAKDSWTFASEVTQYSPFGVELENKDALDRYSSAQYGYNYTLPTAVSSNSRYRDMGMDSFEDYNYANVDEAHFNFKEAIDGDGFEGVKISDQYAHSGKNSVLVPPNQKADLERDLIGELPEDIDYDNDGWPDVEDNCPYEYNTYQFDYDDDGIGDVCDDSSIPVIVSKEVLFGYYRLDYSDGVEQSLKAKYRYCNGMRVRVTIEGKPNAILPYGVVVTKEEKRGYGAFVNGIRVAANGEPRRFDSDDTSHIQLDVRGKAEVFVELGLNNRPTSGSYNNNARIRFFLKHKKYGSPLYSGPQYKPQQADLFFETRQYGETCRGYYNGNWIPLVEDGSRYRR